MTESTHVILIFVQPGISPKKWRVECHCNVDPSKDIEELKEEKAIEVAERYGVMLHCAKVKIRKPKPDRIFERILKAAEKMKSEKRGNGA